LHVLGLHHPTQAPAKRPSSQSFKQWMMLRRWVDGIANACDAYRGLRPTAFAKASFSFWFLSVNSL